MNTRGWRNGATIQVSVQETGAVIGDRVRVASSALDRGRGLMFRATLAPGEGLLIDPCSSIHTMWMRFPIDVLYLDREARVVRADQAMRTWRIGPLLTGGKYVVELPAGTIAASKVAAGQHLSFSVDLA